MKSNTLLILTSVVLASVGLYFAGQDNQVSIPDHVHTLFAAWQSEHGKVYTTPSERSYRLGVFFKNYLEVTATNLMQNNYRFGLNKFSDMTIDEIKIKHMGFRIRDTPRNEVHLPGGVTAQSLDWREKGAVNPIQDEGACGSTYAFSAIDSTEAQWFLKTGNLVSLSVQAILDCSSSYGNFGCNGGFMDNCFNYMKDKGIPLATDYPYKAITGSCKAFTPQFKLTGFVDIPKDDGDALLKAVNLTVVSVAIDMTDIYQYQSGIYTGKCGTSINHAMSIVGYGFDEASSTPFWILRNQWGTKWGENGYMRLVRDIGQGPGRCGINEVASYSTV